MKLYFFILTSGIWILASALSHAILDTNKNGVSDLWEREYNNNQLLPPNFDPLADPDRDGWSNEKEAAANTNPFEPNPPDGIVRPGIVHIPATYFTDPTNGPELLTPETVEITWPTYTGKKYTLLFSPDLEAESWIPVDDPIIANGGEIIYNFVVNDSDKRFWRVAIADTDYDTDGLTNYEEFLLDTDPTKNATLAGIPDLWLATYFTDLLLNGGISTIDPNSDPDGDGTSIRDEVLAGTDPTTADAATSREWVSVTGNGEEDEPITRTGTLTIPAGESRILVVAIASDEYPYYTGSPSQFDDLLEWTITPSLGAATTGAINVNTRHDDWMIDEINGISLPGFPSPTHIEVVRTVTAPATAPLTIDIEVTATNISDGTLPSHIAVGLVPIEITWEPIAGWNNVSVHIDPWSNTQNGQRIFPDFENPDSTELQHKLQAVVKTSPVLQGHTVFVKSFDVDDSTSEGIDHVEGGTARVIDTEGIDGAGDDNLNDYLNTPKSGRFWAGSAWGGDTKQGVFDDNGEAKFDFRVGMQPGNNYRVVASVSDELGYANVQVSDKAAVKYLGCELSQNGGATASPLLTVWRRLWVENDSMKSIDTYPGSNDKKNDLISDNSSPTIQQVFATTAITTFQISSITDRTSFTTLQNSTLKFTQYGTSFTPSNSIPNIAFNVDAIQLTGDHSNIQAGDTFRLYDDDGFGMVDPPLPRNDLVDERIKGVYRPAFIEVMDGNPWNAIKTVNFYRSHAPVLGALLIGGILGNHEYGVLDDALDAKLEGNENLWCASVMIAYQPGGGDNDPNEEEFNVLTGATPGDSPEIAGVTLGFLGKARVSIIYSEVIRDLIDDPLRKGTITIQEYEQRLRLTVAHEIGHQPLYGLGENAHHEEEGLMVDGGHAGMGGADTPFAAKSVKRFRVVHQWRQKEQ